MHNFEEELTCSICYSIFEDPRVLPCSHTFCRNCLENVLQASGNFYMWRPIRIPLKCPNCRSTVEIPPPGIESLPINFALRAIIEKYQQEDHPDVVTCPEHSSQPLNVYCLLDHQLVCGHCLTIGQHHGHPIDDLLSAYVKEKDTPPKLLEQLTDNHWKDVCLLIEKLEEQKSHLEEIVQSDKEVVLHYFKKLNDILDLKKDAFLSALHDVKTAIDEEYSPQIERMKEIREQQLELMSLTTSLGEEESPLKFLEKVHNVRQRVQALKQRKLPHMKPLEIYPRIGQVLKEEWSKTEIGRIKKIMVPEIKLSPQRTLCDPANKEERKAEFLKILSIFILTIFSGMLMLIFLFNEHMLPILNDMSSVYFSEVSQSLYHTLSSNMYTVKETVCHTYHMLKGLIWDSLSCCF
ncbi:tripartite motif-containing protein 59 [Trichosurus vulpecula]|uniref:tripartite motif-containing protein 59 n=1 Tax=Trichosurus vulpecula TaxID=9337 RepID=UPI00186AFE56|nr:tripartite motif-containing protein 59 [Trichosurus vulpecula]XP_036612529.1 tripartite motif-containing protein 59 [Trichosurus vulpecula]